MQIRRQVTCLLVLCLVSGCPEFQLKQKERQMELVARDWSMTIRASQVVPVYPLTQDIQPGDVFLVNRTVADQSTRFRDRGFMPTDLHIARLLPSKYAEFYKAREPQTNSEGEPELVLPRDWRNAPPPSKPWDRFPRVGFPSYSFNVSNKEGLSIAVPVQSVPFALSLTGTASATGSVTISDAVTYGVDASSMYAILKKHDVLHQVKPPEGARPWYLRVVNRIFAAKSFDVVFTATSKLGDGLNIGSGQSFVPDNSGQLESDLVEQINKQLDNGGQPKNGRSVSIRATFASGRTVGFKETFLEPIVVGYHGFDVAIDSNGDLGPMIPTFQVLDEEVEPTVPTAINSENSAYLALISLLGKQLSNDYDYVKEVLKRAADNCSELKERFQKKLETQSDNPVGAWITATTEVEVPHSQLLKWLSLAIRETEK